MSELSFQAMQFTPRFVSVVILLALTWLVAKFVQYMVKRATGEYQSQDGQSSALAQFLTRVSFWAVFLIMSPFILSVAGMNASWLYTMQQFEGQVFIYWPLWLIVSLVAAGIVFLFRGIPKFVTQMRDSFDATENGMQN